jgi:transmembrane sensor
MTDIKPSPSATNDDIIAEQAIQWFARLRGDQVSEKERNQFADWYQASEAHRHAYDDIGKFWENNDFTQLLSNIPLSSREIQSGRRRSRLTYTVPALAAAACLALTLVIFRPTLNCLQADYCTGIGEIRSVQLADGSRITLNSGTALAVDLRDAKRRVQLVHGEAFFEVRRNPQQPFLVDSRHSTTRVLGTQFIVREGSQSDTVTVVSGVVEVSHDRQTSSILKANDSITVAAKHNDEIRQVAPTASAAWLKGSAIFDNAPLSDVVTELGRYRRGSILIKDEALKNLKVSGRFDITDTDKALTALQQTLPIRIYRFTPLLIVIG